MIYKISHSFSPEIFVPWAAIGRNIDFPSTQNGQPVTMSDGTTAQVVSVREVHILSEEAQAISQRLYSLSAIALLLEWYKRNACMTDLFFCNIQLKKYIEPAPEDNAPTIPE